MIIDTSVIVAILRSEPDGPKFASAIENSDLRLISAATYLEAAIVIDGSRDPIISHRFDDMLVRADMQVEPVTEQQVKLARSAYRDYGKGSGHPARLNFGDCFAYALARDKGEPLLYKGTDFSHTDIKSALG